MRRITARMSLALLSLSVALAVSFCAAQSAEPNSTEKSLEALEQRAAEAPADEQCYLYAKLLHDTVEFGAQQYASGNIDDATRNLRNAQRSTRKFRTALTGNVKKLKRAEILLSRAAYLLTDWLRGSRYDDQRLVEETLVQVERADREAVDQVLKK